MIGSEDERVNQDVGTPREGPRTETLRAETIATLSRIQQLADFGLDDPCDRQTTALRGISVRAGQLLAAYGIDRPASLRDKETAK